MLITTRDFGKLDINEDEILEFVDPIFGFEELKRYVLLSDDEAGQGLLWLQSLEKPDTCFILLDPQEVGIDYKPELPDYALKDLQIKDEFAVRLIAVVPQNFKDTTVNLKSPVIINMAQKVAGQVIIEADYPLRMRLFEEESQC